ncbi:ankyrin repeat-containing domain protein, partial [Podospora fimiseda]
GATPLMGAIDHGLDWVAELLLARKDIQPSIPDKDGDTALLCATGLGLTRHSVAKLLLARDDVNLDCRNKYGETALMWACKDGWTDLVQKLLESPTVDRTTKDCHGKNASWWAANRLHVAIMNLL